MEAQYKKCKMRQSPIKVSSLVLLTDQKEKWEGKKNAWCQNIVQPLRSNLRNLCSEILFSSVVQLTFGIWNMRKKTTASILNQRVSQVPVGPNLMFLDVLVLEDCQGTYQWCLQLWGNRVRQQTRKQLEHRRRRG